MIILEYLVGVYMETHPIFPLPHPRMGHETFVLVPLGEDNEIHHRR